MQETFMKERPVLPLILSMALPMVISMMVNSLYNIVDSFFVAQISEEAMTALSLVYPIQNFINAVGIGFGVGMNAVIAFFLGAGEKQEASRAASSGMGLAAVHGIVLTIGSMVVLPVFLRAFTQDEQVLELGIRYGIVAFAFTLSVQLGIGLEKVFQAVGWMKVSMVSLMSGCILNILLDPVLIFGLGPFPEMGIEGAALATGLGQTASLVIYLLVYWKKPMPVALKKTYLKPSCALAKRLYAIGIPAVLNLALPSLLISALNAILAAYSGVYILVLGIYYKLQTFIYLPANGFIQGMRPIMGYNYGAGALDRVRKVFFWVLALCGAMMAVGMVICLSLPQALMGLFTHTPQAIQAGTEALSIICCGFLPSAISVTCCGALEGLGKGVPSLLISLCRYVVVMVPLAFLFSKIWGATGVWHAFWVTELAAAGLSVWIYRRALRR